MPVIRRLPVLALLAISAAISTASGQTAPGTTAPADLGAGIDAAVAEVIAKTGVPSVSLAVVREGTIAYVRAYGNARLDPRLPATPEMRYPIGSITKQFTATAVLLLAEEGRLSLDDRLVRWFPDLTRARDVTLRQLLSMTSGYQDFWPQDYVMPMMLEPTAPLAIVERWAKKPLDFEPGTKWQYSNTNYVILGLVVEKVSGTSLFDLLNARVFTPLGIGTVTETDRSAFGPADPEGYLRFGLGPLRPAPEVGRGWIFGAGGLAMTAGDLARWDISMINQAVMQPDSYRQMETEVRTARGVGTGYGLGVSVGMADDHRYLSHGGGVSGFTARNTVYPDDRAAVVVLTNRDPTNAAGQIATRVGRLILEIPDAGTAPSVKLAKGVFEGLQRGRIDRSLFTANANAYFTDRALADLAASLAPLGAPKEFTQRAQSLRGGMTQRVYRVGLPARTVYVTTLTMPDAKLEQFMVAAED
ncbi:MAG: beta-lactamase family protein [Acidobacteriia bacterium]|nr:beta-lactamase family protein [Terriglobia bacterium]